MLMIINLAVLLFSVILHEVAHGYIASIYGDDTAKLAGRLTLNPLKHIDPFGTVLLPLMLFLSGSSVLFGWAKPVPVNPYKMRNPKKDMMLVGISGPLINYTLALTCSILLKTIPWPELVKYFLVYAIYLNLILGTFNLIPIPPLDGSRALAYFLKGKQALFYSQLERYGIIIIFIALYLGLIDVVFQLMTPIFRLFL